MTILYFIRALLFSLILTSCASSPNYFLLTNREEIKDLSIDDFHFHMKKGMISWKQRHVREKLEDFIRHFEFCARSPEEMTSQIITRYKIYEMLSRGYYLLGNNHETKLSLRKKYWQTGAYWAEKGMYSNELFKKGVVRYGEYANALKFLTKRELGAIYWYLANIGKWAKNSGVGTSIKYIRLIKAMIKKIKKHDPKFFYGGLPRFWGGYFAVLPPFAGGDLEKSESYFLRSIKISPDYLGTKVLFAKLYAVKKRDRSLFKNLLMEVISAKPTKNKDILSENILEKQIAKKALDQINEIF